MIIRIIPETPEEKKSVNKLEWKGVHDYMVFGVHQDDDGHFIDFHSWRGRHQFLIGNLQYFYEQVNGERAFKQFRELEAKHFANMKNRQIDMSKVNLKKNVEDDPDEPNAPVQQVQQAQQVKFDQNLSNLPQAGFELLKPDKNDQQDVDKNPESPTVTEE